MVNNAFSSLYSLGGKCGTINDRLSAAALISFFLVKVRCLFESGASFNYG